MRDHAYDHVGYRLSELEHRYGPNVHIMATPYLLTRLAALCAKGTQQPAINQLAAEIYGDLLKVVINAEFPRQQVATPTRMIDATPRGVFHGEVIDPATRAITVNIARAGTLPSMICYDLLNHTLDPRLVRQDHFVMARVTDKDDRVIGAEISGSKIGGDIDDAILLFPDPMGATGSSLCRAIDVYKGQVAGKPRKIINVHLIVTPEYLRRMRDSHPEVLVYAVRLDRGMSPEHVFDHTPGELWDEERGLNDHQYIVPGGGGFGEIMNNAYV
jgi:uracil phosphoribosyltransferase